MFSAGDVVSPEFPGAPIAKRRPAVIPSSDAYHARRPDLIVGLLTGQVAGPVGPTDHLLVDWQSAGLRKPSMFRAFLATVPLAATITPIGRLSDPDWQAVRACVARASRPPPSP